MRILLIDNHDSFTYNLFHLIAGVTGREPEVVANDDPRLASVRPSGFDAVVLSPGPGDPTRDADFGICGRVLAEELDLPLLGVCLGHQGLAHAHGAAVRRTRPHHGQASLVHHDGSGVFAGLPSPFEAVRYHSLVVEDLPAEVEVTAWTADGLVMGIRHRDLPRWGVQFHPESVRSAHGHDIIANFTRLAAEHNRRTGRVATAPAAVAARPVERPEPTRRPRVLTRSLPTAWDAETAYDRLFRAGDHPYWLDSERASGPDTRFTIMGDAGGPLARVATADVSSGTVTVRSATGEEIVSGGFLSWLDRDLRSLRADVPPLPFDFALGWVGYLGYELKAECDGVAAHRSPTADAVLVFSDRGLVLDAETGTTHLLALAEDGVEADAEAWLADTARRLTALAGSRADDPAPRVPTGPLELRHDRGAYLARIAAAQIEIAAGETYQVCLTNMIETGGPVDPWAAHRYLRRANPTPFGALLRFGGMSVLSTSPERFLSVAADGAVESRPIKGTRPRGATPEEDARLAEELRTSAKDQAENLMVVDLVRHDLGRTAVAGSVVAEDVFQVSTFPSVHQLVSTVRSQSRPDVSAVDVVRAAFPPGSMTGAPKERTMGIIDDLEGGARGVYSGAIGYFSLTGAANLSVAIRTAVLTADRVRYGVGGAIIALSEPLAEFEETVTKAKPLTGLTGRPVPTGTAHAPVLRRVRFAEQAARPRGGGVS